MNNRNRISSTGRKNSRPQHVLKPADGVNEYFSSGAVLSAFFGTLPAAVLRIIMASIEVRASGNVQAVLSAVGLMMLCVGLLASYILSHFGRRMAVYAAGSGIFSAIGAGLLAESEISLLLREPDLLGALQIITMTAFLICVCAVLAALLIGALGARTRPELGIPLAAAFMISALTYIFRAATAFSSLLTALGTKFNWDNTGDLVSARRWILRSVEQGSSDADRMVTVALIYSVAVILAFLLSISMIFGFKPHFEDFGKRLLISLDTHRYTGYAENSEDGRDGFDEDTEDDYYDGMETLERSRYEAERHDEMKAYRRESERVHREAAERAAEMGGYDLDDSVYDFADDTGSDEDADERVTVRGKGPDTPDTPVRTPSGSVRVKVKKVSKADRTPAIPDPDDESIWNHYLD